MNFWVFICDSSNIQNENNSTYFNAKSIPILIFWFSLADFQSLALKIIIDHCNIINRRESNKFLLKNEYKICPAHGSLKEIDSILSICNSLCRIFFFDFLCIKKLHFFHIDLLYIFILFIEII